MRHEAQIGQKLRNISETQAGRVSKVNANLKNLSLNLKISRILRNTSETFTAGFDKTLRNIPAEGREVGFL